MNQVMLSEDAQSQIAPWLKPLWNGFDLNAFPSAVLIYGPAGIGKFEFAITLAKALICESTQGKQSKPCNHCDACARQGTTD